MQSCICEHHPSSTQEKHSTLHHIIKLLQNQFIFPYKILFLLDPKQADYFKSRNELKGCCSSNHITISSENLTKSEKLLKECISYHSLLNEIDHFLSSCNQKFKNIVENGKKDNLKVTPDVEKFLLDKIMMEAINHLLFIKLSKIIKEESLNNNKEIGLWATPQTWAQRYPSRPLDYLPGKFLSQLLTKGWGILPHYEANEKEILRELSLLEKDGKFEQSRWLPSQQSKILNNPEKFIEIKTSSDGYLFEELRQLIIKLSSIPFELNAKANLYCTVSPNLHIYYAKGQFATQKSKGQFKYTVILNFGANIQIKLNEEQIDLESSTLIVFENSRFSFSLANKSPLIFLCFNYIGCAQKK